MIDLADSLSLSYHKEKLCFNPNEFLNPNFSVDEFLHQHRNVPSLEVLRDNLGLYLKKLRASMIDLINEDYADFVSLSANLVGLDQAIGKIQKPLELIRLEVVGIKEFIETNKIEIEQKMVMKHELRTLRRKILNLIKVHESMKKLDQLLMIDRLSSSSLEAVDIERAVLEVIQLKFNEKFCSEYLKNGQKLVIQKLELEVNERLRCLFNETLRTASSTCSEPLERCLRIYITLDACAVAEDVFRTNVVAPYMSAIISEHNLQRTPQGLAGIYSKILDFISLHMTDLLRLTLYTDKLRGFNFLVESFWVDVVTRLENHMASIFALGNSEVFYAQYKCTRDFLNKIEMLLASPEAIAAFRQHHRTKSFLARWNLPVYFQICFQEIARDFESILEPIISEDILNAKDDDFHFQLKPFIKANYAIKRCWSDGVYLSELFPKFLKLHIQIVSRLVHWVDDVLQLLTTGRKTNFVKTSKITIITALHIDVERFRIETVQQEDVVKIRIPTAEHQKLKILNESITKSFELIRANLCQHLSYVQRLIVENLIDECGALYIGHVNDLPRLYRKTNREIPTHPSNYVEQMLRPVKNFLNYEKSNELGEDTLRVILAQVLQKITKKYFVAVNDVLTSVQKTEDSLKRLKNLKGINIGNRSSHIDTNTAKTAAITSDDDKIRLQLRVDIKAWTNELKQFGFEKNELKDLLALNQIVEDSMKNKWEQS